MIAEIQNTFAEDTLSHKIDYQISKIDNGVARVLYNNSGDSITSMYRNMSLVASLNDRVKSPYIEFILSSPVGEKLSDEKFLDISKEYLEKMGYADSCYMVIKNDDKDHRHVHILATTVDMNGAWINDSYSRGRSGRIMRELELKYGIEITRKGKSSRNKTLGESQYRQYFFDTALHKALRSHNARGRVERLLKQAQNFQTVNPDMSKAYTNTEWKIILGDDDYEKLLDVLSKGKFFNPLFKDELLSVMDRLYQDCDNVKEFRDRLESEGYYMRLVSDKGKSHYVYGIPERGFYIKDTSLPERYRFGKLVFSSGKGMTADEQKHYLYNQIFATLHASSSYEDFKDRLEKNNIKLIEHVNGKGVSGISFVMTNVDTPEIFKSSDISRRLTYKNIQSVLQEDKSNLGEEPGKQSGRETGRDLPIEPVLASYANNRQEWDKDINYMYPVGMALTGIALESGSGKHRKEDEELPNKKKKKKRNKGLSY